MEEERGFVVRKMQNDKWRKLCAAVLAAVMMAALMPAEALAGTSSDRGDGTFDNPVIYSDVPDMDIIRVGETYYMVSTTMHLSPGCPVMKSTDLVNWEIVNYVYDTLGDADAMDLRNGESMYGNGQWAASLKYYGGIYYVAFNCNTTGKAYLYATDDIEQGSWSRTDLNGFFHDMALFFDDNGKGYILYGGGEIKCAELSGDFKAVKTDTERTLFHVKKEQWTEEGIGTGLEGEGTHIIKKDGYYYVFNICWPSNGVRTEICHRSRTFPSSEWENKVILKTDFQNNGAGGGVAQGAVIDALDGKWYGFLFQDHGAVGRVPVLTGCTWKNGWPMLGKGGDGRIVESVMPLPAAGSSAKSLVKSDEFYNDARHREFEKDTVSYTAAKARAREAAGQKGIIANGSFENGMDPWTGMENAAVAIIGQEAQDGAKCIATTGRTSCAQGPCQDLSNKLTPGNTYAITAYIKYHTGVDNKKFNVTIQNGPDFSYRTILGSVIAAKGEWTKLETTYKMPYDTDTAQNYLFFETDWVPEPTVENDLMDFYVDHVSMEEQVNEAKETKEPGEHDENGSNLDLAWQWNHNPNNNNWSLTERNGWLRLTAGNIVPGILQARNTLTQRTYGPTCSGRVKMDIRNMKAGDVAGLSAFSYNYGYIAVKKESQGAKLVMVDASANSQKGKDEPEEKASISCEENIVYLKADFDFAGGDKVRFYYSFDGTAWKQLGNEMQLRYELTHFMGSRFGLFHYAARAAGGYADFDYFRVSDNITGESPSQTGRKAELSKTGELAGVINNTCEVELTMDALEGGNHSGIEASIAIPDPMDVEDVVFNTSAINGSADYAFQNHRLTLNVSGGHVSFSAEDRLFATIKLKLNNYVDEDKEVSLKADYIMADNGALEYDVADCTASVKLKYLDTGAIAKKLGYGNPIMTQEFGADPYAIVHDGRVYVYMTADDCQYDENGKVVENDFSYIKSLRVVSSADLMNWTDHGEIQAAGEGGAAKWASHAWAPAAAYKKVEGRDKFFLYFANGASGIGVLEADTPLGPWRDPIGKALITGQTPGCGGVVWCFDPAVLADGDGSAYIYFGGGIPGGDHPTEGQINHPASARVAKLGDDMVSIDGEAKPIDAPCMFEDSGIFKYNGRYYYSYCSNFASPHKDGYPGYGNICYMVSDNPMGPFAYAGEIFSNPYEWFGTGGNNHHATFVFEGESYFIYHAQTVSKSLGIEQGYRSTHIDKIDLNRDGTIRPIKGTRAGISQLHKQNPYQRMEAETIAWNSGIKVTECKEPGALFGDYNMALTDLQNGDWVSVSQLDFGTKGAEKFQVSAASINGGSIEARLDSPEGTLIGMVQVAATGSENAYRTAACDVSNVTGTHNVFLVFRGLESGNIMNVDHYQFTEKAGGSVQPEPGKPGGAAQPDPEKLPKVNEAFTASNGLIYKITAYSSKNKSVAVAGLSKKAASITIPAVVKYKKAAFKVTAVYKKAFKNQKKLKTVTIGKYVKTIGSEAFCGSQKLAKVKFSGTAVKSIGRDAFWGIQKNAAFSVKKSKRSFYKKLLKKANTKNFKMK